MFENAIGCCCGWVDTGVLCVDCRISPGLCTKHEAVEGASTEATIVQGGPDHKQAEIASKDILLEKARFGSSSHLPGTVSSSPSDRIVHSPLNPATAYGLDRSFFRPHPKPCNTGLALKPETQPKAEVKNQTL